MGLFSSVIAFDCQAQFLVTFYEGKIKVPTGEQLEEDMKEYNDLKHADGVDVLNKPFKSNKFPLTYFRHLSSLGNFKGPPHCFEDLIERVGHQRSEDVVHYKDREYVMGTDGLYLDAWWSDMNDQEVANDVALYFCHDRLD